MTEVYAAKLAEEVGPGRALVIKVLPKTAVDDPDAEARFLAEARIILNLTHGNITAAFEFARDDAGRPFLVMEYVPGPSLRRLCIAAEKVGAKLDIPDALFVTAEVLKALSYAHSFSVVNEGGSSGIIHRDISPDNVVISTSGQVKLTDFGIAEFTQTRIAGPIFGKPAYIAPETAAGTAPSFASDLYSTGVVLYECLTGKPPFKGETDKHTLALSASETLQPPSALRSGVSETLDALLLELLDKDPQKRPKSASLVEVRLRAILQQSVPEYTEFHLAKTVGTYFKPSAFNPMETGDGLRASLLAAGISVSGLETTDDLLTGGTVPLSVLDSQKTVSPSTKPFRWAKVVWMGAILLAAVVVAVRILLPIRPDKADAIFAAQSHTDINTAENTVIEVPDSQSQSQSVPSDLVHITDDVEPPAANAVPNTEAPSSRIIVKRRPPTAKPQATTKTTKKPPPDAGEWGWLNINSYPWSFVSVDGNRLEGHTPYRRIKLRAGPHTLVFENPDLALKAVQKVTVSSWEETNIGVRLK